MTRSPEVAAGGLAELYRAHAPSAMRLAYLLTGSATEAEDLVHDAVVRLAARFADLRRREAFATYLKRTVVNLAVSRARRRRVERSWRERQRVEPVLAHEPGPRDELWRALLQLPARQRAALVFRFYEDLSEAQTAEILGCPKGTVKSLVSRGLESLRGVIEP